LPLLAAATTGASRIAAVRNARNMAGPPCGAGDASARGRPEQGRRPAAASRRLEPATARRQVVDVEAGADEQQAARRGGIGRRHGAQVEAAGDGVDERPAPLGVGAHDALDAVDARREVFDELLELDLAEHGAGAEGPRLV